MSKINRYHQPEVYEHLAMSYVLGTLQGLARLRFEALMEQHDYLQTVVALYEDKLSNLAELLPEVKPPKAIWNNIEKIIQSGKKITSKQATPWWKNLFVQGFAVVLSTILMAVLVFKIVPSSTPTQQLEVILYQAILKSSKQVPMLTARIEKGKGMTVTTMANMVVPKGHKLNLWCIPKNKSKPIWMGLISDSGETKLTIDKKSWKNLTSISRLAVSMEQQNLTVTPETHSDWMYQGNLIMISSL